MPAHFGESLSPTFSYLDEIKSRRASLLWLITAQKDRALLDLNPRSQMTALDTINKSLLQMNESRLIKDKIPNMEVPAQHLDWINDSYRQFSWIVNYIANIRKSNTNQIEKNLTPIFHKTLELMPHHLLGRERSIAYVDYWIVNSFADLSTAIQHCNKMNHTWTHLTNSDRLFSWVDGVDAEDKRECFLKFLKKKHPYETSDIHKFNSHEDLLIYFDNPAIARDTKELYSQSVRKIWNQQVRRDRKKDKKQCNFELSLTTIQKLDALSKKHGLSRTEIIQTLIDSEYRNSLHISKKLDRKLLLTTPLE